MFTGIVTDLGEVAAVEERPGGDRRFIIRTTYDPASIAIGASIACDGCCLTAVATGSDGFTVDVSNESLSKTSLGTWAQGRRINLERAMKLGDELGGHIVSGHVDGLATLESIRQDGDSWRLELRVPDALARFVAPKGSVALNGVSLTVNDVEGSRFGVNIIPHTWNVTNIGRCAASDMLNFEVDMLARYVARILGQA